MTTSTNGKNTHKGSYAEVHGLKMYYEILCKGCPKKSVMGVISKCSIGGTIDSLRLHSEPESLMRELENIG